SSVFQSKSKKRKTKMPNGGRGQRAERAVHVPKLQRGESSYYYSLPRADQGTLSKKIPLRRCRGRFFPLSETPLPVVRRSSTLSPTGGGSRVERSAVHRARPPFFGRLTPPARPVPSPDRTAAGPG